MNLRVRSSAQRGTLLLLLDLWTNLAHTEPLFAALMAREFLVVGGDGDVYSIEEVRSWLDQTGCAWWSTSSLAGQRAW